jgi:quercetin dioxygenase-like cupin family protein
MKPVVQRAGEGLVLDVMASRVSIRVRAEDTAGAFSVVEMAVPPGFQAPPIAHRHSDVDWYAFVEDGEIAIELDGVEHRVPRGGVVVVPRGVAFRWRNASDEHGVRWLATYTPGGFEHFFVDMVDRLHRLGHPPTPFDMTEIARPLWAQYGVEPVPPRNEPRSEPAAPGDRRI